MNNYNVDSFLNSIYVLVFIFALYVIMQLHFMQVNHGDSILENTHRIHFNGLNDGNWTISRNTGAGKFVTSNALQLNYANSENEGITLQNGHNVQFEILGSNGAITFDKAYTFPTYHGALNEVLTDNGNGVLFWLPGQLLLDTFVVINTQANATFTLPWGYTGLIFTGTGTTTTFTLVLPRSPVEGQTVLLKSNGNVAINTLVFNGNGYQLSDLLAKGLTISTATAGIMLNFHRGKWY